MPSKLTRLPSDIGVRLKMLRERLGFNQANFADKLGIARSSISRMEQGERPPSAELLFGLVCDFDVDLKDLLCGVAASHTLVVDAIEAAAQVRPVIRAAADTLDDLPQQGLSDDYLAVPLVNGKVAAGPGGVVWNQVESLVWVYRPALGRKHRLIAVRVGGDSMEPTIPNKAIVIVDLDQWQPNGGRRHIWALRTAEGDTQIKRLQLVDERLVLVSDNVDHPLEGAWTGDLRRLVIGKVIWMWRSLE